jgi:hypothetical protein
MATYFAIIHHGPVPRARKLKVEGTLTYAKAIATREFGDGFPDNTIVIFEAASDQAPCKVAERVIRRRKWRDF